MKRVFILLIACLIMVGCSREPTPEPRFNIGDVVCLEGMANFRVYVTYFHFTNTNGWYYSGIPDYGDKFITIRENILIPCPIQEKSNEPTKDVESGLTLLQRFA